jgi:DNA-binding protein H-NS
MVDFISTITNIRSLRVACRSLSLKELEACLDKFKDIVEERQQEEEEKNQKDKVRCEALSSIRALMAQAGLAIEDLNSLSSEKIVTGVQKRNVPPKYRFTDENGEIYTWTGQGRTPTIFTDCMKREGKDKDSYLIKD